MSLLKGQGYTQCALSVPHPAFSPGLVCQVFTKGRRKERRADLAAQLLSPRS